ncbi:hypothetical protein VCRA212O16_20144 [Vibrio crassostreae]|nr:hypothetical protein VCRA212O16_20144 [Vibrio crassostreae]
MSACELLALVSAKNRSHSVTSLKNSLYLATLDAVTQILTPDMAVVLLSRIAVI